MKNSVGSILHRMQDRFEIHDFVQNRFINGLFFCFDRDKVFDILTCFVRHFSRYFCADRELRSPALDRRKNELFTIVIGRFHGAHAEKKAKIQNSFTLFCTHAE